jgi:hypothetical protein
MVSENKYAQLKSCFVVRLALQISSIIKGPDILTGIEFSVPSELNVVIYSLDLELDSNINL